MPPLLGNVITAYFNERKKTFETPKILAVNNILSFHFSLFFLEITHFKVRDILFCSRVERQKNQRTLFSFFRWLKHETYDRCLSWIEVTMLIHSRLFSHSEGFCLFKVLPPPNFLECLEIEKTEGHMISYPCYWINHIFFLISLIYLAAPGLSCSMLDLQLCVWALSCGMWNLVSWPGIESQASALGAWSLSHWTTREVLIICFWIANDDTKLIFCGTRTFAHQRNWRYTTL